MRKITGLSDLERRVDELELMHVTQKRELSESFRSVAHELNPANLIRKGMLEVVNTPGLKSTAIDTAVGSGLGFLSRKLVTFRSRNVLRKLAGTAVEFIVTNLVRNKLPKIRGKTKDVGLDRTHVVNP